MTLGRVRHFAGAATLANLAAQKPRLTQRPPMTSARVPTLPDRASPGLVTGHELEPFEGDPGELDRWSFSTWLLRLATRARSSSRSAPPPTWRNVGDNEDTSPLDSATRDANRVISHRQSTTPSASSLSRFSAGGALGGLDRSVQASG